MQSQAIATKTKGSKPKPHTLNRKESRETKFASLTAVSMQRHLSNIQQLTQPNQINLQRTDNSRSLIQRKCSQCSQGTGKSEEDDKLQLKAKRSPSESTNKLENPSLKQNVPTNEQNKSNKPSKERAQNHSTHQNKITIQSKLTVESGYDSLESEADTLAEGFVAKQYAGAAADADDNTNPDGVKGISQPANTSIARSPKVSSAKGDTSSSNTPVPSNIENQLNRNNSGRRLPDKIRQGFEDYFQAGLSNVRIHTGQRATNLTRQLSAEAFTHGSDLYFSPGAYNPGTKSGDRLLGHELTHVIQQAGGQPAIQRKPKTKPYKRLVKGPMPGTDIHLHVEEFILKKPGNDNLVTEAPIPGNTASSTKKYNKCKVGWADFYKSKPDRTISGIFYDCEKDATTNKDKGWANFPEDYPRQDIVKSHTTRSKKALTRSPRKKGKIKRGKFPDTVWVGDLKPASRVSILGGNRQLTNYQTGFSSFARDAKRQPVDVKVLKNNQLDLPDAINYKKFSTQRTKKKEAFIYPKGSDHRIWVYPYRDGLWLYFDLHKNVSSKGFSTRLKSVDEHLDKLKKEIPRKKKVKTVRRSAKKINSRGNIRAKQQQRPVFGWKKRRKARRISASTYEFTIPNSRSRVQRKTDKTGLPAWEKKRKTWSTDQAEPFLSEESATIVKVDIDKMLGLTSSDSLAKHSKSLRGIRLWSGKTGEIIAKIAFYFGAGWQRLKEFLKKIKTKLSKMKDKLPKAGDAKLGGWKKKVLVTILKGLTKGFSIVVALFARLFSNCFEAILSNAIDKFWKLLADETKVDEELDKLIKPFKDAAEKVKDLAENLKKEFEGLESVFNTFKTAVTEGQKITSFISDLEWPIRGIFQAISCGFPPGWGCLWGIVGQFAMSFVLWTVTQVCEFQSLLNRMSCKILETQLMASLIEWTQGLVTKLGLAEIMKAGGAACDFTEKIKCHINNDPDCFALPSLGGGGFGSPQAGGGSKQEEGPDGTPKSKSPKSYNEAKDAINKHASKKPLPCYELVAGVPAKWRDVQKFLDVASANKLSLGVIKAIHYRNCSDVSGKYILSDMIADAVSPPPAVPDNEPKPSACSACIDIKPNKKPPPPGGGQNKQSPPKGGPNQQGDSGQQQEPPSGQSTGKTPPQGTPPPDSQPPDTQPPKGTPPPSEQQDKQDQSSSPDSQPDSKNPPPPEKDDKPLEWTKQDQEWLDKLLGKTSGDSSNKPTTKPKEKPKPKSAAHKKADQLETVGALLIDWSRELRNNGREEAADKLKKKGEELIKRSSDVRDKARSRSE